MESNWSIEDNCSDYTYIDEDRATELMYSTTQTVIITVIIPIILCLGVITNSSFLLVVIRAPQRVSHTTLYLAHLALADLIYLISSATFQIWRWRVSPIILRDPFVDATQCVIFDVVVDLGYISSVALVTMSAYERFLSLCYPFRHCRIQNRRRTYKLIATCWLVGLLAAVLNFVFGKKITIDNCYEWPDDDKYTGLPSTFTNCELIYKEVHDVTRLIMSIILHAIVVLNTYMYIRIICELIKLRDNAERHRIGPDALQIRVSKMVVVNGVVFFVCQAPYQSLKAYEMIGSLLGVPVTAFAEWYWIGKLLLYTNSSVNPLIYSAMNPQYRAALVAVCGCSTCRHSGRTSHFPTSTSVTTSAPTTTIPSTRAVDIETHV